MSCNRLGSLGKEKIQLRRSLGMGKGVASNKVMAKVPAGYERVAATPKFKQCKVSVIQNFSLGCRRVTASNFGLCRQIAVDQSSQAKW
ncbi:hypothetical protein J1N35_014323 [Gossypium stocksii]|uniref:Uncharacterized protein n=1 Tax=Gossypium stocksii TaxID=47602 RepID=A0A9D4A9T0_9ROSI|nr:hypothetical protein J1N35_014323 [Gossypium stocksii]